MSEANQSSEVVFLFGAGASVPAHVPDTVSFVTDFVSHLSEGDSKATVERVIEILNQREEKQTVDVELLLETLTKLETKDSDPLLQFYENAEFLLKGYPSKKPLVDDLKDFIRSKGIVTEDDVRYLDPMTDLIRENGRIDIISLNYDTCVEQFCNLHRLKYQDGFDLHWNPELFDDKEAKIRLLKLHGSVTWYKTSHSDYMKLPLRDVSSKVELITGETAEGLILYPMQKLDYSGPIVELLVEAKKILESPSCQYLFVVGYSFRDDNIRSMVWDAARRNEKLILILIDPRAQTIFEDKLKYFDNKTKVPSFLAKRTIYLPFNFKEILPYLRTKVLRSLINAVQEEERQNSNRLTGKESVWLNTTDQFAESGFFEKSVEMLKLVSTREIENNRYGILSTLFKISFTSLLLGNSESPIVVDFFAKLRESLVQRMHIQCSPQPFRIDMWFDWKENSGPLSINYIQFISNFVDFGLTRLIWRPDENLLKRVAPLISKMQRLVEYLEGFEKIRNDAEVYAVARYGKSRSGVFMKQHYEPFVQEHKWEEIVDQIKNTEKGLLEEILKWR